MKYTLLLSLFLVLFSLPSQADVGCRYKYRFKGSADVRICSVNSLSHNDLVWIRGTVSSVPKEYAEFIEKNGVDFQKNVEFDRIDIAILDRASLNDGSLPDSKPGDTPVVGRYYPGDRRVYIDIDSVKNKNNVLAHEIVHMINYMAGITDVDFDEALAYNFEAHIGNAQEN